MPSHLGVELDQDVRPPVVDPTLGVPVKRPPASVAPARRLVTLGDSMTHGFQHFAIFNTAKSWPMMVAEQLGIAHEFNYPKYDPRGPGGHPLNLEFATRLLGPSLVVELFRIHEYMETVEDYYENGPGAAFPPVGDPINDNLAIWGWDLRDTLMRTADIEHALIGPAKRKLIPLVNDPGHRAAVTVLNSARTPSGRALTPLEAARRLGESPGGIETLCVSLGANNVLGSVVTLQAKLSGVHYDDLQGKSAYNVWTVDHFTRELALVVDEVRAIDAQHVVWATVPHVTIPPITHGLGGTIPECPRYFTFYARPWETEDTFDRKRDPHLTGYDAWAIDMLIDGYNRAIEAAVRQARTDGLDWLLVDICAVLDGLAYRRNHELNAKPASVTPYPLPAALDGLDTRFFKTDAAGAVDSGGMIGLDGVHPTTCGYGVMAQEFMNVMAVAGVEFPNGHQLDFQAVRRSDTLVSDPPPGIEHLLSLLSRLDHDVDLLERLIP